MNRLLALTVLLAGGALQPALAAGEARFGANLGIGGLAIVDEDDNDLTASQGSVTLSGEYYFGPAGPFLGLELGKTEFDKFELNGESVTQASLDADLRRLTAGYRTGATGQTQFLFLATFQRIAFDFDEDADKLIVAGGAERDFETWRVRVLGNIEVGDNALVLEDEVSFRIALLGSYFPLPELGLNLGVDYGTGVVELGPEDGTTGAFTLRLGLELRLLGEK